MLKPNKINLWKYFWTFKAFISKKLNFQNSFNLMN